MRTVRAAIFCAPLLLTGAAFASDARVTDASGQVYEMTAVRLLKGAQLDMDCGGARIKAPFKSVKEMKITPVRIKSINGKRHFGIDVLMDDSTVIGGGAGRCFIPADNGVTGKSSKAIVTVPFNKLSNVYILGKEEIAAKKAAAKPAAGENEPQAQDAQTQGAQDDEGVNADETDE